MATRARGGSYQTEFMVKGERYRAAFDYKTDGERWEAEVRHALKMGKPVPEAGSDGRTGQGGAKVKTLGQLRDYTVTHHWAVHARRSLAWMESNSKLVVEFFGKNKLVSSIDEQELDRMAAHFRSIGNSDSTVNRKLLVLSKMLAVARDRLKIIETKPQVPITREKQGRIRFLTKQEEEFLLLTLRQWNMDDLHDLVAFAIDTGGRKSEFFKAKWSDFDPKLTKWTIWENKADHPRTVPLTKRAAGIVAKRQTLAGNIHGPFAKITAAGIRWQFDRAITHCRLDDVVFHTLRHTCASRLVQGGVDLRRVQTWLGHKRIETTLRYSHLSPSDLESARAVLEAA